MKCRFCNDENENKENNYIVSRPPYDVYICGDCINMYYKLLNNSDEGTKENKDKIK